MQRQKWERYTPNSNKGDCQHCEVYDILRMLEVAVQALQKGYPIRGGGTQGYRINYEQNREALAEIDRIRKEK